MVVSADIAGLIGFACEATCWGGYVVLLLPTLVLLLGRLRTRKDNNAHTTILIVLCLLFLCCTAHFALEFNHFYTTLAATGVNGYENETKPLIGADILLSLSDCLGDTILLFRCWVVWNYSYWVIIVPAAAAIGGLTCLIAAVYFVATLNPTSPLPPPSIVPLGLAGYALPLCTNVLTTGLIVGKLWWTLRRSSSMHSVDGTPIFHHGYDSVKRAAGILVESGLLYLVTQLIFVVLFSIDHPSLPIVAGIAAQIYGIAPTLIITRVALGISSETRIQEVPTALSTSRLRSIHGDGGSRPNVVVATQLQSAQDTLGPDSDSIELKTYLGTSRVSLGREEV